MPLPLYNKDHDRPLSGVRHVIAVAAGKGGVGKSTVTVNLALQLKARGYAVAVMDADIYGPSLPKMLSMDKRPGKRGNMLFPAESHGIKVMSMAYFRREGEAAAVRAPVANGVIAQFIEQIEWGDLDYLLVDFPPGTGDVQLTLAQKIAFSGAVMVTTPQQVSVIDVRKAIDLFRQMHVPILGVVENMSFYDVNGQRSYPFGQGGGRVLADQEQIPLLSEVPIDPALSCSCDEGNPLPKGSAAEKPFALLADAVISETGEVEDTLLSLEIVGNHLEIVWNDNQKQTLSLASIQRHCPCAACQENPPLVNAQVGATAVDRVGRYAVRIKFSLGCSSGIFELTDLRALGEVHV
jgi:ATP-binding protein involved in chromosome partitioning